MKSATPSIKAFLHLFDHCIIPIALYGCENWGVISDRPFNVQGGCGGDMVFINWALFSFEWYLGTDHLTWKNILIPNVAEKNILILVEEKKIKAFLHLFDHCIIPIALYGCENWGVISDRPFNVQGGCGGDMVFCFVVKLPELSMVIPRYL
jgi:hypothetical protein